MSKYGFTPSDEGFAAFAECLKQHETDSEFKALSQELKKITSEATAVNKPAPKQKQSKKSKSGSAAAAASAGGDDAEDDEAGDAGEGEDGDGVDSDGDVEINEKADN